jgi:hypothetical protein
MSAANTVLQYAESQRGKAFSSTWDPQHGHIEAYCAAFVRWCFTKAGITLPVVMHPESYKRLGLSYVGEALTADGFAGKAVGELVPKGMMPGDILLFRNTYSRYPLFGTITHVGIAADSRGYMYDAGSGSVVHRRHHEEHFPGLLVEVRRPLCMGGTTHAASGAAVSSRVEEQATRLHFDGGPVSAKLKGKPVRDLMVVLHADGRASVNEQPVKAGVISLVIHDVSGAVYKMHAHHNRTMMTPGVKTIALELKNGLLQVAYADLNGGGTSRTGGGKPGGKSVGSMIQGAISGGSGGATGRGKPMGQSIDRLIATLPGGSGGMSGGGTAKAGPGSAAAATLKKIGQGGEQVLAQLAQKAGDSNMQALKPTSVELTILH